MRHRLTYPIVVLLLCAAASTAATCGGHGPDVVVTRVAEYGVKVVQIGRTAQDTLIKAQAGNFPGVTEETTAKAMVQFRNLGAVLEKLANALDAYDALTTTNTAARLASIADIEQLMKQARGLTMAVLVFVPNQELAQQLTTLFGNLEDLFFQINQGLTEFKVKAVPPATSRRVEALWQEAA